MMGHISLVVIVVVLPITLTASARPCVYEECLCNTLKIDCSKRGLTTLPPLKAGHFTETILDISNNNISRISRGQLPSGLGTFTARHTALAHLADDAFADSASSMTSVYIQDSQLTSLPTALTHLTHLQRLSWFGATAWTPRVLTALGRTVTHLTLDRVGMTALPDWLSRDFPLLQSLNFRNNRLTSLRFDSLKSGLDGLSFLHLDNNRIHDIDSFVFPSSVKMLYIQSNNIEHVSSMQFSHGTSEMTYLNLRQNPLKQISNTAFSKLPKLTTLFLDSTQLTRLPLALSSLPLLDNLYLHDIPHLACSCEQAQLQSWFSARAHALSISPGSRCDGADIVYFLSHLAQKCPRV